jgi:hypothetical protein
MIKCDVIRDLIPLYIDGIASEDSRDLIDEHVKDCPACEKVMAAMRHGNESAPINVDNTEIGAFKKMKRKITRKHIRVAVISIICAVVFVYVFFVHQTQMPYNAEKMRVDLAYDQVIDIHYDGNYSATVALQDGEDFYICYRGTPFTRLSWKEDMQYSIGSIIAVDYGRNGQPIPITGQINRIYYMQGHYDEFALNKASFESAKQDAILIWERTV